VKSGENRGQTRINVEEELSAPSINHRDRGGASSFWAGEKRKGRFTSEGSRTTKFMNRKWALSSWPIEKRGQCRHRRKYSWPARNRKGEKLARREERLLHHLYHQWGRIVFLARPEECSKLQRKKKKGFFGQEEGEKAVLWCSSGRRGKKKLDVTPVLSRSKRSPRLEGQYFPSRSGFDNC